MTTERIVRIVAGTLVLVSVGLAHFFSPWWTLLTVFVGANLLQSGFTRWCLLERILLSYGIRSGSGDSDQKIPEASPKPSRPVHLASFQ